MVEPLYGYYVDGILHDRNGNNDDDDDDNDGNDDEDESVGREQSGAAFPFLPVSATWHPAPAPPSLYSSPWSS